MIDAPQRIPMPLDAEEVKNGFAEQIRQAVRESLDRTCSLNRRSFSKVRATWWVKYELDDFGRIEDGGIGGSIGTVSEDAVLVEGVIEPVPPDKFRRDSQQPIPKARTVVKREDDGIGVTASLRGRRKGGDA